MLKQIVNRIISSIPVLLLASFLVFALVHIIPGDAVSVYQGEAPMSAEAEARLRAELNLDDPLVLRYGKWLADVARGDLGIALVSNRPVGGLIADALPVTLQLAGMATVFAVLLGIPAGIISALRRNSWIDFGARWVTLAGVAIPNFWLGIMLILVFSYWLEVLPATGYVSILSDPWEGLKHTVLPALALGSAFAAILYRQMRGALLEVLQEDYVRTAWAKGLRPRTVIMRHAVRNALLPVLTVLGMNTGALLGGAVVTERVFSYPGIGRLAISSIGDRDVGLLQGVIFVAVLAVLLANLATDILYTRLNPRIRAS